jgi:hypothetical protein
MIWLLCTLWRRDEGLEKMVWHQLEKRLFYKKRIHRINA